MADPTPPTSSLPPELPVLPLRNTVVFPLTIQPLAVNRPVSVETVNRALATDRMVLLLLQDNEAEDPSPGDMRRVGTVGIVRQMAKGPAGLSVIVEGIARAKAETINRTGLSLRAVIKSQPEPVERSIEVDAYVRRLQRADRPRAVAVGGPVAGTARHRRSQSTIRCGSVTCSAACSTCARRTSRRCSKPIRWSPSSTRFTPR